MKFLFILSLFIFSNTLKAEEQNLDSSVSPESLNQESTLIQDQIHSEQSAPAELKPIETQREEEIVELT